MTLRPAVPRLALAALAASALGLSGCESTTDFVVEETVQVVSPGGAFGAIVQPVDLSTVGEAWSNRSHVKDLSIRSAQATIVSLDGGSQPTTGTGTLALRPDGGTAADDVEVGTLSGDVKPGQTFTMSVPPEANAILMNALEGSGRFYVVASGSTAAPVAFTIDATVQVHVRYSVF